MSEDLMRARRRNEVTGLEDTFIIGIAGASADGHSAGSGKDFVASLLTRKRLVRWGGEWVDLPRLLGEKPDAAFGPPMLSGAVHMNLADPIKEHAADIYGFTPSQLWGAGKDIPIELPGLPGRSLLPRQVFQRMGTEGGRSFDPRIWLRAMERRLDRYARQLHETRTGTHVLDRPSVLVISDLRFPNEAEWVYESGGEVWFVDSARPGAPMAAESAAHDSEAHSEELRRLATYVIESGTKRETAARVWQIVEGDGTDE